MKDNERCCGGDNCIIDARGHCWCGQQWDGEKMCRPNLNNLLISALSTQDYKKTQINDGDNT